MFGWFRKKADKEFDSKLSELKKKLKEEKVKMSDYYASEVIPFIK